MFHYGTECMLQNIPRCNFYFNLYTARNKLNYSDNAPKYFIVVRHGYDRVIKMDIAVKSKSDLNQGHLVKSHYTEQQKITLVC